MLQTLKLNNKNWKTFGRIDSWFKISIIPTPVEFTKAFQGILKWDPGTS